MTAWQRSHSAVECGHQCDYHKPGGELSKRLAGKPWRAADGRIVPGRS